MTDEHMLKCRTCGVGKSYRNFVNTYDHLGCLYKYGVNCEECIEKSKLTKQLCHKCFRWFKDIKKHKKCTVHRYKKNDEWTISESDEPIG